MHLSRHIFAALLLAAATFAAHADTITRDYSVTYFSPVSGSVENSFGILPFDPAYGTLNFITVTLSGNIVFTPTVSGGNFHISTENILSTTGYSSEFLNLSAQAPYLQGLVETNYRIEVLDLTVSGGIVSPTTLYGSYIFDYTPNAIAPTPEPSSLVLLGTGIFGAVTVARSRKLRL